MRKNNASGREALQRPLSYKPPTPAEINRLIKRHGLTQEAAGQLVGVRGRSFARYLTESTNASYRRMPYAVWELLKIKLGAIKNV